MHIIFQMFQSLIKSPSSDEIYIYICTYINMLVSNYFWLSWNLIWFNQTLATSRPYTDRKLESLILAQNDSHVFIFCDITGGCRRIQEHLLQQGFVGLSLKFQLVHHKNFCCLRSSASRLLKQVQLFHFPAICLDWNVKIIYHLQHLWHLVPQVLMIDVRGVNDRWLYTIKTELNIFRFIYKWLISQNL